MRKSYLVTLGLITIVALSMSFTNGDERLYKNLKVLPKDITKPQLDSVMKHFTAALSVKCNFCHVKNEDGSQWDFPSDASKHKLVAREMMKMTNKINKKYFDVAGGGKDMSVIPMVTCYTCHGGKKEPSVFPPAKEEKSK